MLAEFLSASIRIVVRAVPVDRSIFGDDVALPLARDRDGAHVAETAQPVVMINLHAELDDFERAAQVHVQAAFFGFAVQRRGAMNDGIRGVDQAVVVVS